MDARAMVWADTNLPRFRELFVHADDAYATLGPDGIPDAIRERLNDEVLQKHLEGKARILAYFVDPEGFAAAICIDIDENKPDLARRVAEEFDRLQFDPWIEASKSKGYHVWTVTERAPAGVLRTIGLYVALKAGAPDLEVFPKQAQRTGGGLGNGVWLPLFGADVRKGKTVFLDRGNGLAPYPDQSEVLYGIVRASLETIGAAQAEAEANSGRADYKKKEPVPIAIPTGKRHDTLTRIAGANRRLGLDEAEIYPILAEVNRTRCDPKVPDEDVRKIAKSIMRYAPADPIGSDTGKTEERVPDSSSLDFPDHVMTGLAGDFANLYNSHLEPPRHFFYMSFLTCLGAIVADKLTLDSEIPPQPRLYTVLLGESGDDRKSTGIAKTVDFFKWALGDFPVCWGVGSAEGLQKRLMEAPRLLLGFDELRQFISKCGIESSVLLPCVNTLFESNRYESRTKQSGIVLENVYLSFLAASTVQTYENTWSSAFTDIGFNNRLWLVPGSAKRRFSIPLKAPEGERTRLRTRLLEVLKHIGTCNELELTPAARGIFHDWYMNRERGLHSKRLDTYALRLMALLAVNDLKHQVDEETVRKVIALCDHQYHVRQMHDPIDADNETAKMEEKIRRVLKTTGPLGERELKRKVHADRKGLWIYSTAIKNLGIAAEIEWDKVKKGYGLRADQ